MFEFVLFTFHSELLARKVEWLAKGDWSRVSRLDVQWNGTPPPRVGRKRLSQSGDVPTAAYQYPGQWFLLPTNDEPTKPLPDGTRYLFSYVNQTDELDAFFRAMSERHRWFIVPWGGFMTTECFAFVSADAELVSGFIDATSNAVPWPIYVLENGELRQKTETFVLMTRRWQVADSFEAQAQIVYIEETDPVGERFWDCCVSEGESIYLATGPLDWELETIWLREIGANDDVQPTDNIEVTINSLIEQGEMEYLGEIGDKQWDSADNRRWVYRVWNRKTFLRLASRFTPVNGIPSQALPGSLQVPIAFDLFGQHDWTSSCWHPNAIRKTDSILSQTPWFYTAGECHMDVTYQMFATSDNSLLRRFISPAAKKPVGIVTLF